jgi:lipopolysaccharide/colanic/teichoic acid biosynthesis glycosyltransferase
MYYASDRHGSIPGQTGAEQPMAGSAVAVRLSAGLTPGLAAANTNAGMAAAAGLRVSRPYLAWGKRAMDIALVVLSLPVVLPVILLCAAALWAESGLPFYQQDRIGKEGRRFRILKLRTMVRDADQKLAQLLEESPALKAEWTETQKLKHDPRITRIGGFLRATSLDELPQLWNVLNGEMSLVGPRPMMPDQLALYGDAAAYFQMRPGLTGIWQVSARNESRFSYRAELDAQYFREQSFGTDARLIAKTFAVVARRTGY